jgi:flavin reductase (DIM6/NTAB) family NADH-FMN oxidoreductase RutF
MVRKVLALGNVSGRQTDKFKVFGLETVPCRMIKPPRLAEAPAHLECQVINRHPYPGVTLYVAKVLRAEVEEECWDGQHLVLEKIRTIHHVGGGLFAFTNHAIRVAPAKPTDRPS